MRPLLLAALLALPACKPEAGGDTESLAQCPGNHPDSSIAVWQESARQALTELDATVTAHPSRNCLNVAVRDSTRFPEFEAALRRLGIPRDAVVLTAEP